MLLNNEKEKFVLWEDFCEVPLSDLETGDEFEVNGVKYTAADDAYQTDDVGEDGEDTWEVEVLNDWGLDDKMPDV